MQCLLSLNLNTQGPSASAGSAICRIQREVKKNISFTLTFLLDHADVLLQSFRDLFNENGAYIFKNIKVLGILNKGLCTKRYCLWIHLALSTVINLFIQGSRHTFSCVLHNLPPVSSKLCSLKSYSYHTLLLHKS